MSEPKSPSRRHVLLGAAATAGTLAVPRVARAAPPPEFLGNCPIPTASGVEGPYYFDPGLVRTDITEGLSGFSMDVMVRVLDASGCGPLAGVAVDVWHADVDGVYSGYAGQGTQGQTFLRGTAITDARGLVRFQTIYPGWYPGRTPHMHVKVRSTAGTTLHTSQLYLPNRLSTWVYRHVAEYVARGVHDTTHAQDAFYEPDGLMGAVLWNGIPTAGITLTI